MWCDGTVIGVAADALGIRAPYLSSSFRNFLDGSYYDGACARIMTG